VAVEEKGKVDGLYHVILGLCPANIHIITNLAQGDNLFGEIKKLSDMFEILLTREENTFFTIFKMRGIPRYRDRENTRDLVIVLDSSVPKESYIKNEAFTVFLVSESEKENIGCEIPKFSPLSFVSFQQFISKLSTESS
jgi:hypothetical protein